MLIGLIGLAGSGKDTVGDILSEQGFIRDSFAKPVKDAVAAIFGWDRAKLEGTTKEAREWREQDCPYWSAKMGKPFSPRRALQMMGTEIGREIYHQNLWVDAMERRLTRDWTDINFVITDVRFDNEMEMIHRLGGTIIQVERGPKPAWYHDAINFNFNRYHAPDKEWLLSAALSTVHVSEWGWIGSPLIDHTIKNDGTLDDLKYEVNVIVDRLAIDEA
jgi:hypothetical protein